MLGELFATLDRPYLILRDEDKLPKQSGFDIDILINEVDRIDVIEYCKKQAKRHGLLMISNNNRAVLFHINYDKIHRNWAIVDFQTAYEFGEQSLDLDQMLAMPKDERVALINDVQDARKGRASKDVQEKLGVAPYAKPQIKELTFLQKTKRKILMRAFFIHMHNMPFIVVSGPDGVGKTTLLTNIMLLFETLPFKTAHFHHTGLVKDKEKPVETIEANMSLSRRLRRKYTPKFIKKIYGSVVGEIKYALRINKEVLNNFYSGTLTFSDRYIYDRTVKMSMIPDKLLISKITTRINSRLMRRPTVLIVPTDTPEAIFKRKQELQPEEITRYYKDLFNIIKKSSLPSVHRVSVAGKTPEELAIEATKHILQSLSPIVFRAIGMYEKELKSNKISNTAEKGAN